MSSVGMQSSDEEEEEEEEEMSADEYEQNRQNTIRSNADLMASLGLTPIPKKPQLSSEEIRARKEAKIRAAALKRAVEPTRRSGRVAAKVGEAKPEQAGSSSPAPSRPKVPKQKPPKIPAGPDYPTDGPIPNQPEPTREPNGRLVFEYPWKGIFNPNVTPEEMFTGGAFGGAFFCNTYSKILNQPLTASDDIASLPFKLPEELVDTHLCRPEPDGKVNRFGVRAGQSLQDWENAGWIWPDDPRGWAQWYTRFYAGRRSADDKRQITRWAKVAGPTGRFKTALIKQVVRAGGKIAIDEEDVGRTVRQTLWQWGYQLTEDEWNKVMKGAKE